jgi:hypothetical protein
VKTPDPVTAHPGLHQAVMDRDRAAMLADAVARLGPTLGPRSLLGRVTCIAPLVDPAAGPCGGRSTLDHVKDEPRLGRKPTSDPRHLVCVCSAHSEEGMKAGRQWNTASRGLEREYLRSQYPEEVVR